MPYRDEDSDNTGRQLARRDIAEIIRSSQYQALEMGYDRDEISFNVIVNRIIADCAVTVERRLNENGVAVRRWAVRGEWEVDPEPGGGPCADPRMVAEHFAQAASRPMPELAPDASERARGALHALREAYNDAQDMIASRGAGSPLPLAFVVTMLRTVASRIVNADAGKPMLSDRVRNLTPGALSDGERLDAFADRWRAACADRACTLAIGPDHTHTSGPGR